MHRSVLFWQSAAALALLANDSSQKIGYSISHTTVTVSDTLMSSGSISKL